MKLRKILFILLINALISTPAFIPKAESVAISDLPNAEQYLTKLNSIDSFVEPSSDTLPDINSESYFLVDSTSANILLAKNINDKAAIASTTKMMTALIARKHFQLSDVVTISATSASTTGSSINLVESEKIRVEDLIKGLMIQSGNDAAVALAEHFGSVEKFVDQMNTYATEIGLKNTVYGDPAGLNDQIGRSTAFDLAIIARLVLQDDFLKNVITTTAETVYSTDKKIVHDLVSTNRLMNPQSPLYLPEAIGIKTGYTSKAGYCLVSAYQFKDRILVGVILNTEEISTAASAKEMRKMFAWAQQNLAVISY